MVLNVMARLCALMIRCGTATSKSRSARPATSIQKERASVSDRTFRPVSALSGLAVPGRCGKVDGEAGVIISELTGLGLATVARRKGQASALNAAVQKSYGVDLPASSRVAQG